MPPYFDTEEKKPRFFSEFFCRIAPHSDTKLYKTMRKKPAAARPSSQKIGKKLALAPALSGVLMGISFTPFPVFAMFFALIPLWLFIYRQKNLKTVLIGSWLCQFITTLIGFNWIIYTAHSFGQMGWPLSFLILMVFCSFANIYIVLAGGLWFLLAKKIPKKSPPAAYQLLLFPLIFSLLHSLIPALFPWNMGYPWLWGGLPGAQTAELWGFRFLNSLFYIFNLLLLLVYRQWRGKTGKAALAAALGLFVLLNGLGFYLKKRLPEPKSQINILVIQPNIGSIQHLNKKSLQSHFKSSPKKSGQKRKDRPAGLSATMEKAQRLYPKDPRKQSIFITKELTLKHLLKTRKKRKSLKDVHLIVWPEAAYPYTIDKTKDTVPGLSRFVNRIRIPLLTGAIGKDSKGPSNSLFVLNRRGRLIQPIYSKSKLLAFGEYFPGSVRFPFLLEKFSYFTSNLVPGQGPLTAKLEGRELGFQICYESLFDKFTRELARKNPQILINITNDSWYGPWQEPWQHLTMSLARGIEIRRPLIRATNTGISAVIGFDGAVGKRSPIDRPWGHLYRIPYYEEPPKTLFMGWGFYINEVFLAFLALLCLLLLFAPRASKP